MTNDLLFLYINVLKNGYVIKDCNKCSDLGFIPEYNDAYMVTLHNVALSDSDYGDVIGSIFVLLTPAEDSE